MKKSGHALSAVVMAAGQGTRMKSDRAKVLHPFLGRELVHYPIEAALALCADPIVVVVGHQAEAVGAAVAQAWGPRVTLALQAEQRGTGHAVMMAEPALTRHDGLCLILTGDAPRLRVETLKRLVQRVRRTRGCPLGLVTSVVNDPHGYGRVIRDARGRAQRIVEERDATDVERLIREVNMGFYVAERRFLFATLKTLRTDNAQGEYYLPDLVAAACAQGLPVVTVEAPEAETHGINDRVQLAELEAEARREQARALMQAGVTLVDPASVVIDPRAEIAPDVTIHPNVTIRGACRIGRGCVLDVGNVIEDSTLGERVRLRPYNVIEQSRLADDAVIGPFSHLRPKSVIGPRCHVGNFCETKNTELTEDVKANHLTYLGDTRVGRGTNVGAGTITCNYDGYVKSHTEIGENVFIGSDTQLVAPVTIPDRVVLGAGTTLTARIPLAPGDLVITRPEAVVVPGYHERQAARAAKDAQGKKAAKPRRARKEGR